MTFSEIIWSSYVISDGRFGKSIYDGFLLVVNCDYCSVWLSFRDGCWPGSNLLSPL